MSDISILLDEQNLLEFDVEVQGVSSKNVEPRFIIEIDGMDLSFDGKFSDNKVSVNIPILANTVETKTYNCRLEMIVEGEKLFTPMNATLDAILPVKVRAGIKGNNRAIEQTKVSNVSFSAPSIHKPTVKKPKAERETETKEFNFEFKALDEATGEFTGYAAVFGNIDSHNDIIRAGAFKKTLQETRNVKLLWQHDTKEPIGAFTRIYEDHIGLVVEGKLAMGVKRAQEVFELMKLKALEGLSIGYKTILSNVDQKSGVRTLNEVRLMEVSVVTFPSNDRSVITSTKSKDDDVDTEALNDLLMSMKTSNESNVEHSPASTLGHIEESENNHQAINELIKKFK